MELKRDTKAALLQTAIHLLWSQSYGGVSVDDICAKAKVKKGSFYHYFESKSELVKAAMEQLWEHLRPEMDKIFSAQHPPLERLRLYAECMIEDQARLRTEMGGIVGCPFTSIGSEQCSCDNGVTKKSEEILCRFRTYLRSAIQDAISLGEIPPIDPDRAAARLLAYELGAMSFARVSNSLDPLEGLGEVWLAMLGAGGAPVPGVRGRGGKDLNLSTSDR